MKNIYVQDGELSRKDHTIKLVKEGKLTWVPIKKIKEVNCFGGCTLTNEFLDLTREHQIAVHLFSWYGRPIGTFHHQRPNKNGKVLKAQLKLMERDGVILAKKTIKTLRLNMLKYLDQYRKKGNEASKKAYQAIKGLDNRLEEAQKTEEIMGVEGITWQYFYTFLKTLYTEYNFNERNKQPPKDPVNALISFLNTLLYNRIETEFSRTDIYTEISYLHSSDQKRNSLVLDIAELYKIDITYRLISYILRKRMINKDDFLEIDGMCTLSPEARKIVITEYERYMQKTFSHPILKRRITLENSIKLEAFKLIRAALEDKTYEPICIGALKLE
ncbi:CRISPR-associated endonuclease Cas1 [Pontibacillus halophilus]|uniref:CRISPR-associated endonuclease Cas1 n=1 Tax=Pontibacillus halophilus TaxID=516704 RepID=UPI00040DE1AC|nr:CRISPR-associated endonuclease Cas1 [Pontibacillus halophilus]